MKIFVDGKLVTSETPYCGVSLVGGYCKRPLGHSGKHTCS